MRETLLKQLLIISLFFCGAGLKGQDTIFVDINASGANNGTNWTDAYDSLHVALNNAVSGDQIWIAAGVYKRTNGTDRSLSFDLQASKELYIYGGFFPGQMNINTRRPFVHKTILSGDIGVPANNSDNSFHVLRVNANATFKLIDGLQIRDGHANGGGPDANGGGFKDSGGSASSRIEFRNCIFARNRAATSGGAVESNGGNTKLFFVKTMFNDNEVAGVSGGGIWHNHADSLVISHSRFFKNVAPTHGGGIWAGTTSPLIVTNSVFSGNTQGDNGGGIFASGNIFLVEQSTFSENNAGARGGAIYYNNASTTNHIRNSIFWRNTDAFHPVANGNSDVFSNQGAINFSNSIVEGSLPPSATGTVSTLNPQFVDSAGVDGVIGTPDDDLRVKGGPAVNGGSSAPPDFGDVDNDGNRTEPTPLDASLRPRTVGGLEIGAYEGVADPFLVITAEDEPFPGTLRAAVFKANNRPGPDTIRFDLSLQGSVIFSDTTLTLTDNGTYIDADVNNDNVPDIELNGISTPSFSHGFRITSNNNTIEGFAITNFSGGGSGIYIQGGSNNSLVTNYVGLNLAGNQVRPNSDGISLLLGAVNNTIGDSLPGKGNVITGNANRGILVESATSKKNKIFNNIVGLDPTGNNSFSSAQSRGVYIQRSDSNYVGTGSPAGRNIISGNGSQGIYISTVGGDTAQYNLIQGNYIGTNISGLAAAGGPVIQSNGIQISTDGSDNFIGDPNTGIGNVISGNSNVGVQIDGGSKRNILVGNIIGLDKDGNNIISGTVYGVRISGDENQVGIPMPGAHNVISGNSANGILINGGRKNAVVNNRIGTNTNGTIARPNNSGVYIQDGTHNFIGNGGSEKNIISGNTGFGVVVQDSSNVIVGNNIGVQVDGISPLGNGNTGIYLSNLNAANDTIVQNIIANNGDAAGERGIRLENNGVQQVLISQNNIYNNYDGAISRVAAAQNNIMPPQVTYISPDSLIAGTSLPNARVEVYADNNNQAEHFLGGATADAGGNWSLPYGNVSLADSITALQMDPLGNTSILSAPISSATMNPYNVTNNSDLLSIGSLRFAVAEANSHPGRDTITFSISGQTIVLDTTLTIAGELYINASGRNVIVEANSTFIAGIFLIDFENPALGSYIKGLDFHGAGFADLGIDLEADHTVLDSVKVYGFNQYGIAAVASNDTIRNSHIFNNRLAGIGTGTDAGALIYIDNNKVGTDASGNADGGGTQKIGVLANRNVTLRNNVISGNDSVGVVLGRNNLMIGNLIGVNTAGSSAIANTFYGVSISNTVLGGKRNQLGDGTVPGRNIISGNGNAGIRFNLADSNSIVGNIIGMNISGNSAISNTRGIEMFGGKYNTIGDSLPGHGNLISGNNTIGVYINGITSRFNRIASNLFGAQLDSVSNAGPQDHGVYIHNGAKSNMVGGLNTKEGNVFGHFTMTGIFIQTLGTDSNKVFSNLIGVNRSNTQIPNSRGLHINLGSDNEVGRHGQPSIGNRIAFNSVGVRLEGGNRNIIAANSIESNTTPIEHLSNANFNVRDPRLFGVNLSNTLIGKASPHSLVEIFADSTNQGMIYIDSVRSDAAGDFTYDMTGKLSFEQYLTVMQDSLKNSSRFSNRVLSQAVDPLHVISTVDDEVFGSLRSAINYANNNIGPDSISFDAGIINQNISILSQLPAFTDNRTLIDGDIDGDSIPSITITTSVSNIDGLVFNGDNNDVLFLNLNGFNGIGKAALSFVGSDSNDVIGNYIGSDLSGLAASANPTQNGILINNSNDNIIGDTIPKLRNVIVSSTTNGLTISGTSANNQIRANNIGLNKNGTNQLANGTGLIISGPGYNKVGIAASSFSNVISGNTNTGLYLSSTDSTYVINNIIGLDITGMLQRANSVGLLINNGNSNLIGDTIINHTNIVSGNTNNIRFIGTSDDNIISNNIIGLNINGTAGFASQNTGIQLLSSVIGTNYIGTKAVLGRNVISGHSSSGINLQNSGNDSTFIVNNYIGTDITGTSAIANLRGILSSAVSENDFIGDGTIPGRNIISGNTNQGILLSDSRNTYIDNNYIGLQPNGVTALGNGHAGIDMTTAQNDSIVNNRIAHNSNFGIRANTNNAYNNIFSQNNIYNNVLGGIEISNGAQRDIKTPYIFNIRTDSTVEGFSSPNSYVHLFADNGRQGQHYLGNALADAGGSFSFSNVDLTVADSLTVLQDSLGNTSAFSLPLASQPINPLMITLAGDDSVPGDIRFAFAFANSNPGPDTIRFSISNTTILVKRPLGTMGSNGIGTVLDGESQNIVLKAHSSFPSGDRPLIGISSAFTVIRNLELDGSSLARHGIFFDNPGQGDDSKADNLFVHHFQNGIVGDAMRDSVVHSTINQNSNVGVSLGAYSYIGGNKIGTDAAGNTALGGQKYGVIIGNLVQLGGATVPERNIISGNDSIGVLINGSMNNVIGNFIGLNSTGAAGLGNQQAAGGGYGILVTSGRSVIDQNVISGHTFDGINLQNADSVHIKSNLIGLNSTGNAAIANNRGIDVLNSHFILIGDSTSQKGNVISAGTQGIQFNSSNNGKIYGNYFGTDSSGTSAILSSNAAIDLNGNYNRIGNATVGGRNIINGSTGIFTRSNARILGNYIGTDRTGSVSMGTNTGIRTAYDNAIPTYIGDGTVAGRNIISGTTNGVLVHSGSVGQYLDNIKILGNYFGLDPSGTTTVANTNSIDLRTGYRNVEIGNGTVAGRNIIGGGTDGIIISNTSLAGSPLTGNAIINNNLIGFNASMVSAPISNSGIRVHSDAIADSIINNTISNANYGILIPDATVDSIVFHRNSIFNNTTAPIQINSGSQANIASPVIYNITPDSTVSGFSAPNALVHVYSSTNQNNAEFFVDSVHANGAGNWAKKMDLTVSNYLTATQDSLGRSSGLSNSIMSAPIDPLVVMLATDDSLPGDLRFAIAYANNNIGPDTIRFAPMLMDTTIIINSQLPPLTDNNTTIDGDINGDTIPSIRIIPGSTGYGAFVINSAHNKIKNLNIANFSTSNAIYINNSSSRHNKILGNYIGTNLTGTTSLGSANSIGIFIIQGDSNLVGDSIPKLGNLISGNTSAGLYIRSSHNEVYNNLIGTNLSGLAAIANQRGIVMDNFAVSNLVGSGSPAARNIIAGNTITGLRIANTGSYQNKVSGNYIGLGVNGTTGMSNGSGIQMNSTTSNLINANVISANSVGLELTGTGNNNNSVVGNIIGMQANGTAAAGNTGAGIHLYSGSTLNTIGNGTALGANYISGNGHGIRVTGAGTRNHTINYNYIGTQIDGNTPLGNQNSGIQLNSSVRNNLIINNIIRNNGNASGEHGIDISDNSVDSTRFVNNRISNNFDKAIHISAGSHQGIAAPQIFNITLDSTVYGFAAPGATVELYADNNDEAFSFIAQTTADAQGDWSIASANLTLGTNLTALQDSLGRSSELSSPILSQPIDPLLVTTTIVDSIPGSLPFAISHANANAGADTIRFNPALMNSTINLTSPLAALTDPGIVIVGDIDGNTIPDITLNGSALVSGNGFEINGDSVVINGFKMVGFANSGMAAISFNTGNDGKIENSFLGTADGTTASANEIGIRLTSNSDRNTLFNNLIVSSNASGININNSDSTVIIGNKIGVDSTGVVALGNNVGIMLLNNSDYTIIGDSTSILHRNIISGNLSNGGMWIRNANHTKIYNNIIGLGRDGSTVIANGNFGIRLEEGVRNTLLGNGNGNNRNIISGNTGGGVDLYDNSGVNEYNIIRGNYIGTDISGTLARGNNGNGVRIRAQFGGASTRYNQIGGLDPGEGNVISSNSGAGVYIVEDATYNNTVNGNIIGSDPSLTLNLGNTGNGVVITNLAYRNTLNKNTIVNSGIAGVYVSSNDPHSMGNFSRQNVFTENLVYNNSTAAYNIELNAQQSIRPPVITNVLTDTTITGTAAPNAFIQLFEDSTGRGQARSFVDSVRADAGGNWAIKVTSFNNGVEYLAMQDSLSNSSALSVAYVPIFKPEISTNISSAVSFPSRLHGTIAHDTLTVFNNGNANLTINSISIKDSTHYSVNGIVGSNIVVPSASTRLAYQYNPMNPGAHIDTLYIYSNDIDSNPVIIALSGAGTNATPTGNFISTLTINEDTTNVLAADLYSIFSDANGDSLSFVATNALGANIINSSVVNDSLYINTIPDSNGLAKVAMIVSDAYGGIVTDTLSITVNPVNDAPASVNPDYVTSVPEDTGAIFLTTVGQFYNDVENDPLSYSIVGSPSLYTANISNDSLYITTVINNFGTDTITVRANDGNGGIRDRWFTVNILNVNIAPRLTANLPDFSIAEDTVNAFLADFNNFYTDLDGDALVYSLNPITGITKLTTNIRSDSLFATGLTDSNGLAEFQMNVSDGNGGVFLDTVRIMIDPRNDLPQLVNVSLRDVALGMDYRPLDTLKVNDVDNDAISFNKIGGASWLTLNTDGTISGIASSAGNDSLVFVYSDGSVNQQRTLYFNVHDVSFSIAAINDTIILGDDSRSFNYSINSTYTLPVDYQIKIGYQQGSSWLALADTNFTLSSTLGSSLTAKSSHLSFIEQSNTARLYIENSNTSYSVDSMDVSLAFGKMKRFLTLNYNASDFIQNIQNGTSINSFVTVSNRAYIAANPVKFEYNLNDNSRINATVRSTSINSGTTSNFPVSFDFNNMNISALTGNIFIIDSTFVKDTLVSIPVSFNKTILGTISYNTETINEYDGQTLLKSGLKLRWNLSGTGVNTLSQLRLESRVNNLLDTVYAFNLLTDSNIELMSLKDGDYRAIVSLQDQLVPSITGDVDSIRFTISSRQISMERAGFWSLIGSANKYAGNISGLLDDPSLVYWYWDTSTQSYVKLTGSGSDDTAEDYKNVDPKRAYWVKLKNGSNIRTMNINNAIVDTSFASNENEVTLNVGWNLISNPWNHDIALGNQLVMHNGSYRFAETLEDTVFRVVEYNVVDSSYTYDKIDSINSRLTAKRGYWAYSNKKTTLKFRPYLTVRNTSRTKNLWAADILLSKNNHKYNIQFSSSESITKERLYRPAPKLYNKGFDASINNNYSSVKIPSGSAKDYYRYELELIGKAGDQINIDVKVRESELRKYIYLQKPGLKGSIRLDKTDKPFVKLTKNREKYLVYVSENPNFEAPFVPTKFNLLQNYPNPFNPVTTVSFDLPFGKDKFNVNVIIYNLLGQKIKTLFKGKLNSGTRYFYQWNGKNDYGKRVASGIYFYRVTAGSFVQSKKMVLIK